MSDETFKSLLTTVTAIQKKEDSERLFHVSCLGWTLLASGIDSEEGILPPYKIGDPVVYLEPDTVLDEKLIKFAFPEGMAGKIKPDSLESHRLRTIKLRGSYSQGMLLDPVKLAESYPEIAKAKIGDDVKKILNTKKYEPPASALPKGMKASPSGKKHPLFKEYTDLNNFKYYPDLFLDGDPVYLTEKIHGSSGRWALLPTNCNTWWKKLLKFLKLLPEVEFLIGSRRVQIGRTNRKNNFYKDTAGDIWTKIAKQYDLANKLKPGEELFGEIAGSSIQKNYEYGHKPGEISLFAYDVMKDGKFLSPDEFIFFCYDRDIPHVPVLNKEGKAQDPTLLKLFGPAMLEFSHELIDKLKKGDSNVGGQKIREGLVIKPAKEENDPRVGRKCLKIISEDFLGQKKEISDFH